MSGFVLKFGHYTASFSANVAARSITHPKKSEKVNQILYKFHDKFHDK